MSIPKKTVNIDKSNKQVSQTASNHKIEGFALNFEDIQKIINLVSHESIEELLLESTNVKLHIRKAAINNDLTNTVDCSKSRSIPNLPISESRLLENQSNIKNNDDGIHYITSPIVGTFYRAPSTSAAAFVQVGESVKIGQTLCIIEAMKLMNEIECDKNGTLLAVLVEDGQPVEYGERLFSIQVN